ncbi:hypothetical protein Syun_002336 [Stephania yunnanensis]|uniref:Protein-S-isoprenylcysteine O-methyltransferase n=1 Tax=Stephania yunnanensis TaxID=152371 RepID=A0AAP0LFL2_9MAGN
MTTEETFQNPRLQIESISPANQMGDFFSNGAARRHISLMFIAVAFFHVSEYFLAITIHGRSRVPLSSLLISKQYLIAMGFSLLEYALEVGLVPEMKELWWVSYSGVVLVVIGEVVRKGAIVTAGRSFTHMIKIYHEDHHQLVRHGIYAIMRHPGYCGFFVWAIGIQIMMCNPMSTVAFMIVLWNFFSKRIQYPLFLAFRMKTKDIWLSLKGSLFW